jgi:hypothetical protein
MAPRHGKKAKKLSVVELLDADSDELNLIHPNSTTSLNSDNEEQLEDKLSSDSEDEEDEEGEGEDKEEEGSGPIPSPPPTISKKRKRTRKSESFVS